MGVVDVVGVVVVPVTAGGGASPVVAEAGSCVVSVVTSVTWMGGSTGLAAGSVLAPGVASGTAVGAGAAAAASAGETGARCARSAAAFVFAATARRTEASPELSGWACSRTTTGSLESWAAVAVADAPACRWG